MEYHKEKSLHVSKTILHVSSKILKTNSKSLSLWPQRSKSLTSHQRIFFFQHTETSQAFTTAQNTEKERPCMPNPNLRIDNAPLLLRFMENSEKRLPKVSMRQRTRTCAAR